MPERPAWRFQKIIKPMFDVPTGHWVLKGRILTCVADQAIEDGFVELDAGKIKAMGRAANLGAGDCRNPTPSGKSRP